MHNGLCKQQATGLVLLAEQLADGVFPDDFGRRLAGKNQYFLALSVDVQLTRANNGRQVVIIVDGCQNVMVFSILF